MNVEASRDRDELCRAAFRRSLQSSPSRAGALRNLVLFAYRKTTPLLQVYGGYAWLACPPALPQDSFFGMPFYLLHNLRGCWSCTRVVCILRSICKGAQ